MSGEDPQRGRGRSNRGIYHSENNYRGGQNHPRGGHGNFYSSRGSNYRNQFGRGWRNGNRSTRWRGGGRGSSVNTSPVHDDDINFSENSSMSDSPNEYGNKLTTAQAWNVHSGKLTGPYSGWKLYVNEDYEIGSSLAIKLKIIEKYYLEIDLNSNWDDIKNQMFFFVNYKNLTSNELILKNWPNIVTDIIDNSEMTLNIFGLAMHHLIALSLKDESENRMKLLNEEILIPFEANVPKIHARLIEYEPVLPLKNMKSNTFSKFICVKGTVVKVSNVKPLCTAMAFRCEKCFKEFVLSQPYGRYTVPVKCLMSGCRSQTFHPLYGSELTETVDWQSIRLQEITVEEHEAGRMPRSVECELMYDLVDCCVPGDIVAITGIVKVMSSEVQGQTKSNKDKCTFMLYILCNSVTNLKNSTNTSDSEAVTTIGLELSFQDLFLVQTIQAEENLFKLLVASLCPSIYGHEMVKAGLLLGLFGGTQKYLDQSNRIPIRGDPHILVVGDPGLGKSQMLQACINIAPRGVFVCGNTTSTAGLTVTLTKEGGGGDYTLEAGALVLGDQGCCCIDEFDKMSSQHSALLEAMEQQTISIAKAGMVCSLPARTSILAAANPVGGHYNKARTVSENLHMGSALLSRFDLVFILLDKPDKELDCKLSEHIIALHSGKTSSNNIPPNLLDVNVLPSSSNSNQLVHDSETPLVDRLKYKTNEPCDVIPHQLLRKYLAYAKKYVQPEVSPEAAKVIQNFYLELRKRLKSSSTTPITTRQLESLIRLSEARAKLEMRETVTQQDAWDVVQIMKHSMIDVWSDEFGLLDLQRSQHGSGMSGRSAAKKFISALTRISERTCNSLFSIDQMKQIINDCGLKVGHFGNFVDSLNLQGYILKKGPKLYKLLTTDY